MANKKSTEREIRRLTKVGKQSIAVTIPIEVVRDLGWHERQNVTVKRVHGGVLVKNCKDVKGEGIV